MRSIKGSTDKKGLGLAYAGASLGALFLALQLFIGYQGLQAVRAVENAPAEALTLGLAGNTGGFRDAFHGVGAGAKDSEIVVFLDEIRRRYGGLLEIRLDEQVGNHPPVDGAGLYPYVMHFTEGSVRAEVKIVFNDRTTGAWFVNKIDRMVIVDEERGDLVFPNDADPAGNLVQVPSTN